MTETEYNALFSLASNRYFLDPTFLLFAYVAGSIPFGLVLSKIFIKTDIRKIGSGNIGVTNVLRTGNKPLALATLLLDLSKGAIAIGLLFLFGKHPENYTTVPSLEEYRFVVLIGLFAVIGHCYPVWLKFKGGKGVATALGVFLAATPWAGLAALCAWLAVAFATKISSLSALIALLTAPVVTYFIYGLEPAAIALLITALVWWRHRENIKRLVNGTEPKISFKKAK